ncbi:6556_t:CDS:2 [Funneliformis geosporum]|uniref:6556_t:CDS:1 n=1 Tax=Funneliformis geosporum TaxID=1117311 RepID=A0A9W4WX08_9GLOM|nr:6556_t:CDS:2 [Funneliformis geosporum]
MSETSFSRKLVSVLFGVPFIILIFACPVFEILKLEYFNRTNEKLVYDTNVEYTYLVLSLIAPISYTIFTIHELGDIPFTCPKDSNYSAQVQNACRVRAINLVLMWTFAFFLIMNILSFVFEMYSFNENGGGKFVERSIPKILYDDKDDENTQRYLSPITQPPLGTDSKGGEQHQFSKIELVVYTHYTRDDIGDIPFSCPSDYPYPIPKLRLACIIRATNFIFMWMYTCLNIVFLLAAFSGILPTEDELKREKKELNIKTVLEGIDIEDDEIRKGVEGENFILRVEFNGIREKKRIVNQVQRRPRQNSKCGSDVGAMLVRLDNGKR